MSYPLTRERIARIAEALYRAALLADARQQKIREGSQAWHEARRAAAAAHADYMAFTDAFPIPGQTFVTVYVPQEARTA